MFLYTQLSYYHDYWTVINANVKIRFIETIYISSMQVILAMVFLKRDQFLVHSEGNAVHTVHLWQPSGNRPNKPKLSTEKRNKSSGVKKRVSSSGAGSKRVHEKKKNTESSQPKIIPPPTNMIPEPASMQFHDNGTREFSLEIIYDNFYFVLFNSNSLFR